MAGGVANYLNANYKQVEREIGVDPSRLQALGGVVQTLEVDVNGQRKFLSIGPNCAVVLAMGAIELTRLALLSFLTPLMGRNLMVHLRTNLTVRIRKSALAAALPAQVQACQTIPAPGSI